MSVHPFISWEIQDNVKLRSIISQTIRDSSSTSTSNDIQKNSDQNQPKQFVQLRPFQHPELTNCGACHSVESSCELRLVCLQASGQRQEPGRTPVGGIFFHSVSLDATAGLVEVCNSRDCATPVAGTPIGAGWCKFFYVPTEPSSELRFKFLAHSTAGSLKLANIRLTLQHLSQLDSEATEAHPLKHQQQQQQHDDQSANPTEPAAEAPHSVSGLYHWLEARLQVIEHRLDERLSRIETRLDELVPFAGHPT